MGIAKWIAVVLATVAGLYLIAINFSGIESRFQCSGTTLAAGGLPERATVYIKLVEYRWWVHLWAESDASLNVEIPNTHLEYFEHVMKVGDQFQIYDRHSNLRMKGHFSSLNNVLALATPYGFFDGQCARKE